MAMEVLLGMVWVVWVVVLTLLLAMVIPGLLFEDGPRAAEARVESSSSSGSEGVRRSESSAEEILEERALEDELRSLGFESQRRVVEVVGEAARVDEFGGESGGFLGEVLRSVEEAMGVEGFGEGGVGDVPGGRLEERSLAMEEEWRGVGDEVKLLKQSESISSGGVVSEEKFVDETKEDVEFDETDAVIDESIAEEDEHGRVDGGLREFDETDVMIEERIAEEDEHGRVDGGLREFDETDVMIDERIAEEHEHGRVDGGLREFDETDVVIDKRIAEEDEHGRGDSGLREFDETHVVIDERIAEEDEHEHGSVDGGLRPSESVSSDVVSDDKIVDETRENAEVDEIRVKLGEADEVIDERIAEKDEHECVDGVETSEEMSGEIRAKEVEIAEKEGLLDDDEDWEGIERSGIEKRFDAAARFVGSADNRDCLSQLGSDLQMQLYALRKVAIEGPCYEPSPMALMVSARAKWNAWQKLGNMSPEVAMEQYISILSEGIPGWEGEKSDKDYDRDKINASPEIGKSGTQTHGNYPRIDESQATIVTLLNV